MDKSYGHTGRPVNLTTLFLGRLRPERFASNESTYIHQLLATAILKQRKEKRSKWSDLSSSPGPLGLESYALPTVLFGPAYQSGRQNKTKKIPYILSKVFYQL